MASLGPTAAAGILTGRRPSFAARARLALALAPAVAALVIAAAGCTVGPDYRRPTVSVPAQYRGSAGPPEGPEVLADVTWWRFFPDEALQSLIRAALAQNNDLRVAAARILDARQQVTITRSFQFPEVSASASAPYTRVEGSRSALQFQESFAPAGFLDFFFEIDFWGRYRRATEAARADLLASEEARRFIVTTLVSDVATAYLQLRALDLELDITRRTLAARRDSLGLVTLREERGVSGLIDVRQAEILVQTAAEAVPDVERQIEQTENALSTLLGVAPEGIPRPAPATPLPAFPAVPPGVPSALLERRPDVRQAEAELASATARIGVAKADFFPRVFLTGSAGAGGVKVDGSWFGPQGLFAIGPSLTLPIFNSGRVAAGVKSAEARAQAALAQYEQVILQAFRDVSDSLVEARRRRESRVERQGLVMAAEDTARLANIRYTGGVSSYLEVLDSERQLFDSSINLVRAYRDEQLAVVRLYKSVGGGWQDEPGPPEPISR
jgi:multidrug efflux system outer membrane protein